MTPEVLTRLLARLDVLILERTGLDSFQTLSPLPRFVPEVFPDAEYLPDLGWDYTASAFLEHFMVMAKEHWVSGSESPLWSEYWVESDGDGKEHTFLAVALAVEDVDVLVVFRLMELGENRQQLLQQARKNLLLQRYLEGEVEKRTRSLRRREEEIVFRLIGAADYRDEETGTHIRRMGLYAQLLVKHLGWNSMNVAKMRLAASMHDVGKIGIPDDILLKPGRLTESEFRIMKSHALIGGKMLEGSRTEVLRLAYEIAVGHHERWDGSGYPKGLKGEEIPLAARIVALCDVFDALAHDRVYRQAMPMEKVLQIMQELKGKQFDPDLFDLFMSLLPDMLQIKDRYKDESQRKRYVPIWEA